MHFGSRTIPKLFLKGSFVVIHHRHPLDFVTLLDYNVPRILPDTIELLESPNLPSNPAIANARRVIVDDVTFKTFWQPFALEERLIFFIVVGDIGHLSPVVRGLDFAEDVILVISQFTIKDSLLSGAFDSSCAGLHNINVEFALIIGVRGDVKGHRHHGNGSADEPADALELQNSIEFVRLGLVLHALQSSVKQLA